MLIFSRCKTFYKYSKTQAKAPHNSFEGMIIFKKEMSLNVCVRLCRDDEKIRILELV